MQGTEILYKKALVEYLLKFKPDCLASEVPFLDSKRRADILMISEGSSYAYEIKAERDRVDRIETQIDSYIGCFDYVYLFLACNHRTSIKNKKIPRSVGVMFFDGRNVEVVKKAKKRKVLSKGKVALSLDSYRFRAMRREGGGVKKLTVEALRESLIKQWKEKYTPGYESFKSEMGERIHVEDIYGLGAYKKPYIS